MSEWNARRILKELCDPPRRREVLIAFWKSGEKEAREAVAAHLARVLRFRVDSIRKATPEKKAEYLGYQMAAPEMSEALEIGLMNYHTLHGAEMLGDFLDQWKIPHVGGQIEVEEYKIPSRGDVEAAVKKLRGTYELRDILLYLATAGLLMGKGESPWQEATWPVVDALAQELKA